MLSDVAKKLCMSFCSDREALFDSDSRFRLADIFACIWSGAFEGMESERGIEWQCANSIFL